MAKRLTAVEISGIDTPAYNPILATLFRPGSDDPASIAAHLIRYGFARVSRPDGYTTLGELELAMEPVADLLGDRLVLATFGHGEEIIVTRPSQNIGTVEEAMTHAAFVAKAFSHHNNGLISTQELQRAMAERRYRLGSVTYRAHAEG